MSESRACPACQAVGRDKNGDHLYLLEDGVTWYCNKPYHKPYFDREGEEEEVEDVQDVLSMLKSSVDRPVPKVAREDKEVEGFYRGISADTYRRYEVYGSYEGDDLKRLSHPVYEIGASQLCVKYRELPKSFKTYGNSTKGKKVELFGQRVARSSKTLVITEGEIDAMSLEDVLSNTKYAKPAVVSLPFGANLKALHDNAKFISKYKKLVICSDNDEAGDKFAREVASLYPDALFMDLGSDKDLNEMLKAGKYTEITSAYFDAGMYKPPSLVNIDSIIASIKTAVPVGYPTPWPSLDELTYGISQGSIISVAAAPGCGKTIFLRQINQK